MVNCQLTTVKGYYLSYFHPLSFQGTPSKASEHTYVKNVIQINKPFPPERKMWQALIRIQCALQRIRPLTIEYSLEDENFVKNIDSKTKLISNLVDFNLVLDMVASFYGLQLLLSNNEKDASCMKDEESTRSCILKMILNTVLQILFIGLYSLVLAGSWTIWKRTEDATWMMIQSKLLFERREREKKGKGKKSSRTFTLFDFLLYSVVVIVLTGVVILSFIPLISENTPAHLIFKGILPSSLFPPGSIWLTILCVSYLAVTAFYGALPCMQVMVFMCAALCESQLVLRPSYEKNWDKARKRFNFHHAKMLYFQNILLIRAYNSFGYVYFPLVMMTGFTINVTTSFVCLKFYKDLDSMLLLVFGGFDVICAFVTGTIHKFTMISTEEGKKFTEFWKGRLFGKRERKEFRAFYPTRIMIGQYFPLQRSTLLQTIDQVVDGTVTLLLAEQ
ncbi:unnamed protein product [Orchesella dallaii]|uniref:Odorant receptor n=1 Tax=Orchesella dallaii TaxID=48710 RepID=A0ABP1S954_9HEXA